IGFQSGKGQQLVDVDAQADATGRIEPGLYVAGWLRRGPVGTIPTQRSDARELAELVVADLQASQAQCAGMPALRSHLARATTWDVWLRLDSEEKTENAAPRPRTKLPDSRRMRFIAVSVTYIPRPHHAEAEQVCNTEHLPAMSIAD